MSVLLPLFQYARRWADALCSPHPLSPPLPKLGERGTGGEGMDARRNGQ